VTRAATILAELAEKLHFESLDVGFLEVAPLASFQRLGYILDAVLEESQVADWTHGTDQEETVTHPIRSFETQQTICRFTYG
jgi:hypothetical protein